jgi:hypothetical protein
MVFESQVKLFLQFDDNTLVDSVTGEYFVLSDRSTNEVVTIQDDGFGYTMTQSQGILGVNWPLAINTACSVGFWFYPTYPGMAQDPDTDNVESMLMPLFSFGEAAVDPYTSKYEATNDVFVIHEETLEGGYSRIVVTFVDINGDVYTATTQGTYERDKWHFIWVAWDGVSSQISVYIDGSSQTLDETGSLPTMIDGVVSTVWINNIPTTLSSGYNLLYNSATINDLIILNVEIANNKDIQQMINLGVERRWNDVTSNMNEIQFGILFNDPAAVKITDILFEGSHLYATRTDGRVLRGSPIMWQSRRDYANPGEADVLVKFSKDVGSVTGVEQSDGLLKIRNGTVRL